MDEYYGTVDDEWSVTTFQGRVHISLHARTAAGHYVSSTVIVDAETAQQLAVALADAVLAVSEAEPAEAAS